MASETLRPNGVGSNSGWTPNGEATNWECVDEETSDGDSTFVSTPDSDANVYDSYATEDSAIGDGDTINSVTVYGKVKSSNGTYKGYFDNLVYVNSTIYEAGNLRQPGTDYEDLSHTWTENPDTEVAWTKADIDALEIGERGVSGKQNLPPFGWIYHPVRCTQVWAVVDYTSVAGQQLFCLINMMEY